MQAILDEFSRSEGWYDRCHHTSVYACSNCGRYYFIRDQPNRCGRSSQGQNRCSKLGNPICDEITRVGAFVSHLSHTGLWPTRNVYCKSLVEIAYDLSWIGWPGDPRRYWTPFKCVCRTMAKHMMQFFEFVSAIFDDPGTVELKQFKSISRPSPPDTESQDNDEATGDDDKTSEHEESL